MLKKNKIIYINNEQQMLAHSQPKKKLYIEHVLRGGYEEKEKKSLVLISLIQHNADISINMSKCDY